MENLLTYLSGFLLGGSLLWFWIVTLGFIVILFVSDFHENGYIAFVSFLIFIGVIHWASNVDLLFFLTWEMALMYFGGGLLHAFIRTYFIGRKPYKHWYIDGEESPKKLRELKRERLKSKLKGNVFRWWFLAPVSCLNWLFSDLLKELFTWLYDKLNILFEFILDSGIDSIPIEDESRDVK